MTTGSPSNLFLLYSDFNCPFCYALHERLHELNVISRCEWRGVQHAPHLPRPMKSWEGSWGAELRHEVSVVQRLAPTLPIALPSGKPNTQPAIEQAVSLLRQDVRHGMDFVRSIYRAFWREGQDISDPQVLKQIAGEHFIEDVDGESRISAQKWETAWYAIGHSGVPLLVAPSADLLVGCVPVDQVQDFFSRYG